MHGYAAREYLDRRRVPFEFGLAIGALVMVVAALIDSAAFSSGHPTARLVVIALAAALFSAVVADWRSGLPVAVVGYLVFNGFLANRYGELGWHGPTGMRDAAVIVSAATVGWIAGRWRPSNRHTGAPVIRPAIQDDDPREEA